MKKETKNRINKACEQAMKEARTFNLILVECQVRELIRDIQFILKDEK